MTRVAIIISFIVLVIIPLEIRSQSYDLDVYNYREFYTWDTLRCIHSIKDISWEHVNGRPQQVAEVHGGFDALLDSLVYPSIPLDHSAGGLVHFTFIVTKEGLPECIFIKSELPEMVVEAIIDDLTQLRFIPAEHDGFKVNDLLHFVIEYKEDTGREVSNTSP